jgi:hypothetical protein
LFPIRLADLTKEVIFTSTAVFPWDIPPDVEDFRSKYPGNSNVDPYWTDNLTMFSAWWHDSLAARDKSSTAELDEIRDEVSIWGSPGDLNNCRSHQVCS